jgi:recyclin-1
VRGRIDHRLAFGPFTAFLIHVLNTLRTQGAVAVRVFPPRARLLLLFAARVGSDVLAEYVASVLSRAREIDAEHLNRGESGGGGVGEGVYLRACAASFMMAWKIVDVLVDVGRGPTEPLDPAALKDAANDAPPPPPPPLTSASTDGEGQASRWDAEEIVFRMMEPHMDEYLDEEVDSAKRSFDAICKRWEVQVRRSISFLIYLLTTPIL